MRLIDADELIKRIGKWIPKDPCGKEQTIEEVVVTDIAVSVCMEIEETPTAYDKEKVLEELRSEADRWHESGVEFKDKNEKGVAAGFRLATHIVERGGLKKNLR